MITDSDCVLVYNGDDLKPKNWLSLDTWLGRKKIRRQLSCLVTACGQVLPKQCAQRRPEAICGGWGPAGVGGGKNQVWVTTALLKPDHITGSPVVTCIQVSFLGHADISSWNTSRWLGVG